MRWQFIVRRSDGEGENGGDETSSGGRFPAEFEIDVAQILEGAMYAYFYGADGDVEEAGDFLVFEALETREHQQFALGGIQGGERGVKPGGVVGRDGAVGGVWRLVGHGVEIVRISGDGRGAIAAEMVGGDLAGEVVDPGGELALVAVGVPVFQDPVEHELHEILAGGALAGQPHETAWFSFQLRPATVEQVAELVARIP